MMVILTFRCASALEYSLSVCVPDQSVPPFYLVQEDNFSGFTIERLNTLFQQKKLEQISLRYVLQPWQRCLKAIENGEVDMLVAGYSQERAIKAVYPDSLGFDLDESIFSFTQICLVKKRSAKWTWNGEQLEGRDSLILGLESGFLIPGADNIERTVSIWDTSKKYELVERKRVDAVLTVCGVMNEKNIPEKEKISNDLEVIFPPYIDSPVYLVFSDEFYRRHPKKAALIIKTLIDSYLP
jgi:hypothetical protein